MSIESLLALFSAMLLLAIIPGPAVFTLIARSFSSGAMQGIYMTIGILIGDYVFIILALFGLSAIAEFMGAAFVLIKYISVSYLLWLGYKLITTKATPIELTKVEDSSIIANFLTGLFITLGNPKAILFYVGFFPAFINNDGVSFYDMGLIMLAATLAFGSVNIAYCLLSVKAKQVFKSPNATNIINKTAGTIMISTGAVIAVKT